MNKTKQLSEGAMMLAIIGVCLFFNIQTGTLFESSIYWVLSFPMMVYASKYGFKPSLILFVACMLLAFMIARPTTLFYLFAALFLGIAYGCGVYRKLSNRYLLIIAIVIECISLFFTTFILASMLEYDIMGDVHMYIDLLSGAGFSVTNVPLVYHFVLLIYIASALLQAVIEHVVAHILLPKMKVSIAPLKAMSDFQSPKWIVGLYLISLLFYCLDVSISFSSVVSGIIQVVYTVFTFIMIANGCFSLLTIVMKKYARHKQKLMVFVSLVLLLSLIPGVNYSILIFGIIKIFKQ